MRNALAFVAALTLTLLGVGWYLDWFKLHAVPADSGHRTWTVDVNTEKIGGDVRDAEHKLQHKLDEKNHSSTTTQANAQPVKLVDPTQAKQPDSVKPAVGNALRKIEGFIELPDR